jgi:hypothetical protein
LYHQAEYHFHSKKQRKSQLVKLPNLVKMPRRFSTCHTIDLTEHEMIPQPTDITGGASGAHICTLFFIRATLQLTKSATEDARIRLKHLNENGGPCVSRNVTLQNAQGEFVTCLDHGAHNDHRRESTSPNYL